MGVILTVDQGNSSVKYTVFSEGGRLQRSLHSTLPDLDILPGLLGDDSLDGVIFASVGGIDARFVESLRRLCDERFILFTPSTPVPLRNNYRTQTTLGVDRMAAAVGASELYPGKPLLIADTGSALTCDLISAEPAFCGGIIAPGVEMRLKALHSFTARLPQVSPYPADNIDPFPTTTEEAIRNGALLGVIQQIRATFRCAQNRYPECRLLMTGGDATPLLDTHLLDDLNPYHVPPLVAVGLNRIYRYNESIS